MQKLFPQRTCVCCRKKDDKNNLIRLSMGGGAIAVDMNKTVGRGVYVCAECASGDRKKLQKGLSRAFRKQVSDSEIGNIAAMCSSINNEQ